MILNYKLLNLLDDLNDAVTLVTLKVISNFSRVVKTNRTQLMHQSSRNERRSLQH